MLLTGVLSVIISPPQIVPLKTTWCKRERNAGVKVSVQREVPAPRPCTCTPSLALSYTWLCDCTQAPLSRLRWYPRLSLGSWWASRYLQSSADLGFCAQESLNCCSERSPRSCEGSRLWPVSSRLSLPRCVRTGWSHIALPANVYISSWWVNPSKTNADFESTGSLRSF